MAAKTNKLTKQEEKFAQGLFLGDSQRTAYRNAFKQSKRWKDKTVDEKACRLAKTGKVKARLEVLRGKMADKVQESALLSAQDILNSIANTIALCESQLALRDDKGEITGINKTALNGLTKNNELYGKHLKLFTDKVEHSGEIKMPVIKISK